MNAPAKAASNSETRSYIAEYDAITQVMNLYNEGVRTGSSAAMKPGFHEGATFYGFYRGQLLAGPIKILFDWVDGNGAARDIRTRIVNIEICETIAFVRIEMENLTGKLAGEPGGTLSDLFQLISIDGAWKISQKSFHWHTAE